MKRYKKLMLALAAILSLYLVRATGLDQGLIDEALNAAVEAITNDEEVEQAPRTKADMFDAYEDAQHQGD